MEFGVLGPVEAVVDGVSVRLTRRSVEVLAVLLARFGSVVSVEELIDALWEDKLPGNPHAAVHTQVSRLRDLLEPGRGRGVAGQMVVTHQHGYSLSVVPESVDAVRFRRSVDEAVGLSESDPAGAVVQCEEALGLWRGPAFGEFAGRGFAVGEALGLTELRRVCEETLVRGEVASGKHREAVGRIEVLLDVDPLREVLWGQLMLAQYRSGNQVEALRAFRRAREVLRERSGLDPSRELQQLEVAILLQDPSLDADSTVSSIRLDVLSTVPVPIGSFIGREGQVDAVNAAIDSHRLVTLTGPGGLGKSRLAIEAARARSDDEFDVIGFARFDELSDPNDVPGAVLDAFGMSTTGSAEVSDAVRYLRSRRCLLILDGCETVFGAAARLVRRLLEECAGLRVLATSRQRLGLPGEQVWPVPFLQVLDLTSSESVAKSEAVDLFLDRWGGRDWSDLDDRTAATLSRLVADLDGLPLAIELVAAGSRSLALADIVAGVDRQLAVELDPTAPSRLQSLQASLDWSWNALSDEQRDVVARLAVFEDGWNIEAAAAVCSFDGAMAAARSMAELSDRSIIVAEYDDAGPSGWYRMTHVQHTYARQKLIVGGRIDDVKRIHAEYYADRITGVRLTGDARSVGLNMVVRNQKNLDAALRWSLDHEPRLALGIASPLAYLSLLKGRPESGIELLDRALEMNPERRPERADALTWWARLATPRTFVRRPTVTFSHPFMRWARNVPGSPSQRRARGQEAVARIEEAIEIGHELDFSKVDLSMLLTIRAFVLGGSGQFDEAVASLVEARSIGDDHDVPLRALMLTTEADLELARGNLEQARATGRAALAAARQCGWSLQLKAIDSLTRSARAADDRAGAYQILSEAQGLAPSEFALGEIVVQTELGRLAADLREFDNARRHFGAALSAARRSGNDLWTATIRENQAYLEFYAGRLDAAMEYIEIAVSIAHARGDTVMVAWFYAALGVIALERDDFNQAAEHFRESLRLWDEPAESVCFAFEGSAVLAATSGDDEYAAQLFGAGAAERNRILFPDSTYRRVSRGRAEVRGRLGGEQMDRLSAAPSGAERRQLIDQIIESAPTIPG